MLRLFRKEDIRPPKTYFIELTNVCNFRCSMCNFHSRELEPGRTRPKGFMDPDLADRILDEVAAFGAEASVALHGAGESLLHPEFGRILRLVAGVRNINAGFLTNGMLLDGRRTAEVLDAGISWIGFSMDGIDKVKFEKYRIGADFDRISDNVLIFLEENSRRERPLRTMVNMTLQQEMREDVDRFLDFWIDKVDEVCISPYRPIGSRINVLADGTVPRVPCYMLSEMMLIYWDGTVGLCCEDWFNDGRMGDARTEHLNDIWKGKGFSRARRLHREGRYGELPLCGECNSWYNPVAEEYVDEVRKCTVRKNAWQYTYRRR